MGLFDGFGIGDYDPMQGLSPAQEQRARAVQLARQTFTPELARAHNDQWRKDRRIAYIRATNKCCGCDAYPWPHGIAVGKCEGERPLKAVIVDE